MHFCLWCLEIKSVGSRIQELEEKLHARNADLGVVGTEFHFGVLKADDVTSLETLYLGRR